VSGPASVSISDEVAAALAAGQAVVALESSLIAQGLPSPHNLETALASERAVRDEGAVPATTAIDGGRLLVGAGLEVLERLADPGNEPGKAGSRDLAPILVSGTLASTTVSAAVRIAGIAGIRVLATGGIGGVHRGAETTFDISSDIDELAATRVAVVCSGPKSMLDLPATLELLETRRVPVIGIGVDELPAFYSTSSGLPLAHRVDGPRAAAAVLAIHLVVQGSGGILFVQPVPADLAIPSSEVATWVEAAAQEAARRGIRGGAVTPFVLGRVAELSEGRTLRTNIGLIVNNARMAARVAVALAEMPNDSTA
jgi:pseudouridine-5'-phosphate glycosidase